MTHTTLPGIGGSLFPSRYLVDRLLSDARVADADAAHRAAMRNRLQHWWRAVSATCGPATSTRALFDVAAMPLAAALGFRAIAADFTPRAVLVRLESASATRGSGDPVALLVAPWAQRSPAIWRDAVVHAHRCGASWALILAPPYLHVLDARHWSRRAIELSFPETLENADSFDRLWTVANARAFSADFDTRRSRMDALLAKAISFQDAVRADLQRGVADSLDALTIVITPHAQAQSIDATTASGEPLAIIYRILFLLFAESRDLLPWRHPLYRPAYSISTMCASALANPNAAGFWPGLAAVSRLLRIGCRTPELDVPPFNGHLFARAAAPTLERRRRHQRSTRSAAEDHAIAGTLVNLSTRRTPHGSESIAYHDLGVEQLGAVYEHVLGHPHRKQSGTFYTPRALTEFVVRRTLTPLTRGATADQILNLRIVDPAMGSGAFLVASCRHLASAYERALVAEGRITEHEIDAEMQATCRRLVAQRCIYGVDRNPVAVQLARLSLWLATLAAGKPLTFLDHRLRTGDALIGARPDDLRYVANRRGTASMPLFDDLFEHDAAHVAGPLLAMAAEPDDAVEIVRKKEAQWARLNADESVLSRWRLACDLWCTRWFPDESGAASPSELRAAIDALTRRDRTLPASVLSRRLREARRQSDAHRFFHWPLEFADAFVNEDGHVQDRAGFDAVVGNPPWEMLRADHSDGDSSARLVRFIRGSGSYRACGRGHVNLYQPFVERALELTREGGQIGLVLPWGLASDDGAADLRARLLDRCRVTTLIGLDNIGGIFSVHRGVRFLALTASPGGKTDELPMIGGVKTTEEIDQLCDHDDELKAPLHVCRSVLSTAGGSTRRIPDVRSAADLRLLDGVTRRWRPLGNADGWNVAFGRELNVTDDRSSFGSRGLAVIEGKHIRPFGVDAEHTRYRIALAAARSALPQRGFEHARLAYRDVSAVSNHQSLISAIVPAGVVTTHTLFCLKTPLPIDRQHFLCACFNSYVLNAIVRFLMGGHLTTSLVESLPVPLWTGSPRQLQIATIASGLADGDCSDDVFRLQSLIAREYAIDVAAFEHVLRGFKQLDERGRNEALRDLAADVDILG